MAATSINIRSPRMVTQTGVANDSIKVELFLWNDPDSVPVNPTYTLEKPIPSSIVTQCDFDIAPYCRNYIEHISYVEVTSDTAAPVGEYCYCNVKVYKNGVLQTGGGSYTYEFICFDGFGYYADGGNPAHGNEFLTDGSYYVNATGNSGGVFYYDDQSVTWEAKYTGLSTGGVTTVTLGEVVGYVPYVHTSYVGEGNKLEILENSVVQNTFYFYEQEECKYETINCDFVNMHGAWQRIVFFKASKSSFTMSNTEYDLLPDDVSYNTLRNVRQVFNVNGQETITVNTGWVFESYSDVMKQLLLSEKILLNNEPVVVESKSLELQKNINNKNINYNLTFRYANPVLNYNI
jgi:hypothetical protein